MKYSILLFILTFFIFSCSYGQYPRTSISDTGKVVLYGVAGVKKERVDSTKIYWKRYVKLRSRGIPDSLNPYTSKLKK